MHDFNFFFFTKNCVTDYQAEVRGFQHDGSLHLQARSEKYGKVHASSATLAVIFNLQFPTSLDGTAYASVPLNHYQSHFNASNLVCTICKSSDAFNVSAKVGMQITRCNNAHGYFIDVT